MTRGRKNTPTTLKVLKGNPGQRRLPENEPKPKPATGELKAPAWMNSDGKKMWKRLASQMQRIGLLTEADLESFTMLCQSYGDYVEGVKDMKKNGKYCTYTNKAGAENEVERPVARATHRAYERYKSLCAEFGLTPASRSKIEIPGGDGAIDEMEALLTK